MQRSCTTGNGKKKEISKLEKKIFKQNRKIFKLANGNKMDKFNFYNSVVNEDINKLKTLYDELQDNYFLERVSSLNDDSTLYDVLYLVASNYNYLNLLMKKNNIDSKNEYNDLCEFVFYPHINILSNILINDEIRRFINFEFSNQYMLFLRNCDGLNVSDKSFKILKLKDDKITLEEEL